jgi:hypothetical protein
MNSDSAIDAGDAMGTRAAAPCAIEFGNRGAVATRPGFYHSPQSVHPRIKLRPRERFLADRVPPAIAGMFWVVLGPSVSTRADVKRRKLPQRNFCQRQGSKSAMNVIVPPAPPTPLRRALRWFGLLLACLLAVAAAAALTGFTCDHQSRADRRRFPLQASWSTLGATAFTSSALAREVRP